MQFRGAENIRPFECICGLRLKAPQPLWLIGYGRSSLLLRKCSKSGDVSLSSPKLLSTRDRPFHMALTGIGALSQKDQIGWKQEIG